MRSDPKANKMFSHYALISRIVLNLVSNAINYSKPGTPLTIKANRVEDKIRISVIDQGQGIKEEDLPHIFKRLYRVESSRNMETGGHGLGHSIAQQLAHQLGGTLTTHSQYGKGSTFELEI